MKERMKRCGLCAFVMLGLVFAPFAKRTLKSPTWSSILNFDNHFNLDTHVHR